MGLLLLETWRVKRGGWLKKKEPVHSPWIDFPPGDAPAVAGSHISASFSSAHGHPTFFYKVLKPHFHPSAGSSREADPEGEWELQESKHSCVHCGPPCTTQWPRGKKKLKINASIA